MTNNYFKDANDALKTFSTGRTHTRRAEDNYSSYLRSSATDIFDVYERPSKNKAKALAYCLGLMQALDGANERIISYNSMVFTFGFEFTHPITGVACFAYITKDYNRFCELV